MLAGGAAQSIGRSRAPIVGATKPHHLPEAIAALELKLTDDEAAAIEKPYSNHGPSWY